MITMCSIIGGGIINRILSRHGQRRKYLDVVTPQKRFSGGDLDSGWKTLTWNESVDWDIDVDCPKGVIFMLAKNDIKRYEIRALGWDDTAGNVLVRVPGYDKYEAFMKIYGNLGSKKPNSHIKIIDLAEPTF